MSPKYFQSDWCCDEFIIANEKKKRLFPVQWKDCPDFKFKYPQNILGRFPNLRRDLLRYIYDENAINMDTEEKKCACDLVKCINER